MKILPQLILLMTGLAAATSLALAADPTTPLTVTPPDTASVATAAKPHHHARLKAPRKRHPLAARAIGRRLDLSGAQKTQLKALRQQTAQSLKGIRRDSTLSPDQKKAKLRETAQGARAQAGSVLTPAQKMKAAKLRRHLHRLAAK